MTCSQCNDTGTWTQYLPGTDPKNYPVHVCRACRCKCGARLDPGVFHDDDETGAQVCAGCCTCEEK